MTPFFSAGAARLRPAQCIQGAAASTDIYLLSDPMLSCDATRGTDIFAN
ncbi:MAG TPA: hypothetical protein V6C81_21095 [Planktothrix sp.]|jgi:hypothetical protein